jgi:hypothetical protein
MSRPDRPSVGDQLRRSGLRRRLALSDGRRRQATISPEPASSTWIAKWGVVVAACITTLGVILVEVINSSSNSSISIEPDIEKETHSAPGICEQGTLSVTSVTLEESDRGRLVRVKGHLSGPVSPRDETIYAIARPVTKQRELSKTRNWYVTPAINFDKDGAWEALIEISSTEARELAIQVICAPSCPVDLRCAPPPRTNLLSKETTVRTR